MSNKIFDEYFTEEDVKIVRDYNGSSYLTDIEEDKSDVLWAIKYIDHGDEFVLLKTKNGDMFKYGWFKNRRDIFSKKYIRDHQLFAPRKKPDYRWLRFELDPEYIYEHKLTNIYEIRYNPYASINPKVGVYEYTAQEYFDEFISALNQAYSDKYEYDFCSYDYKFRKPIPNVILEYLVSNKIDTVENLMKFHDARWTSERHNGCIGIAAKSRFIAAGFWCDDILMIYINGEWQPYLWSEYFEDIARNNADEIRKEHPCQHYIEPMDTDYDDWGYASYGYSIDDFDTYFNQTSLF